MISFYAPPIDAPRNGNGTAAAASIKNNVPPEFRHLPNQSKLPNSTKATHTKLFGGMWIMRTTGMWWFSRTGVGDWTAASPEMGRDLEEAWRKDEVYLEPIAPAAEGEKPSVPEHLKARAGMETAAATAKPMANVAPAAISPQPVRPQPVNRVPDKLPSPMPPRDIPAADPAMESLARQQAENGQCKTTREACAEPAVAPAPTAAEKIVNGLNEFAAVVSSDDPVKAAAEKGMRVTKPREVVTSVGWVQGEGGGLELVVESSPLSQLGINENEIAKAIDRFTGVVAAAVDSLKAIAASLIQTIKDDPHEPAIGISEIPRLRKPRSSKKAAVSEPQATATTDTAAADPKFCKGQRMFPVCGEPDLAESASPAAASQFDGFDTATADETDIGQVSGEVDANDSDGGDVDEADEAAAIDSLSPDSTDVPLDSNLPADPAAWQTLDIRELKLPSGIDAILRKENGTTTIGHLAMYQRANGGGFDGLEKIGRSKDERIQKAVADFFARNPHFDSEAEII